jgi:aminoglycoside 6'-N-acetyltransferase I
MIRWIKAKDREPLNKLLKETKAFKEEEIDVAMELIDIAINNPDQKDYHIFVYEDEKKVLGYHCTGKRPLTDGVFDMYWIAVSPSSGKKGIGRALLQHAEDFVKENNGRWLIAETSSKQEYIAARSFYEKNNFQLLAEIKDFYSVGDNLLIFGKLYTTS